MSSPNSTVVRPRRSVAAAITLFFVAPFVAEYLLGDLSLKLLPLILMMAPMYGGGALLIRELVRHKGRGWPTILCLGAAYALLEEGLVTQSLFNPDYLKLHLHFLAPAHIAWIGTGGWWLLLMLNVHTFWSIAVSIALVEGLFPEQARTPWLGRVGHDVVDVVFLIGLVGNTALGYKQNHFWASRLQLGVAALACVVLIVVALAGKRGMTRDPGSVPSAWLVAGATLVLGLAFELVPPTLGWGAVAVMLTLDGVFLLLLFEFSWRMQWTPLHTLSVGAGGALAYGLHAFLQHAFGGSLMLSRVGNVVFLAIAAWLIILAVRRTQRVMAWATSRVTPLSGA